MRCDARAPSGRQCPHDATHVAGEGHRPVYACATHTELVPDFQWRPLADEPPVLKLARAAAEGITRALATERDAAAEVGTNDRRARTLLDIDRQSAAVALGALAALLPPRHVPEVAAMADGAARGFAVPSWSLRVVALASEVARG